MPQAVHEILLQIPHGLGFKELKPQARVGSSRYHPGPWGLCASAGSALGPCVREDKTLPKSSFLMMCISEFKLGANSSFLKWEKN